MEDERISRLNAFLATQGIACDILPEKTLNQLLKIDDDIQSKIANIKRAENEIKVHSINVLNVAAGTKIARKTFYNNELFRQYVEYSSTEFYSERIQCRETIKELKNKVDSLEDIKQKFMERDIETENLRSELETTRKELLNMQKIYKELKEKHEKLLHESERASKKHRCVILEPSKGFCSGYKS